MNAAQIVKATDKALQARKIAIMSQSQSGASQTLRDELWLVAAEQREREAYRREASKDTK
jgi:hypothetical protein